MPFTLFHLGPGFFLWSLFQKNLNVLAVLLGSIVLDIEPFLVLFLQLNVPLHGLSHTYLVAFAISLLLAWISVFVWKDLSFKKLLASFLLGTSSHVFLDSFIYPEMQPFWPFPINSFIGILTPERAYSDVVFACILLGFFGIVLFTVQKVRNNN